MSQPTKRSAAVTHAHTDATSSISSSKPSLSNESKLDSSTRIKCTPEQLYRPPIAWPTVLLFTTALGGLLLCVYINTQPIHQLYVPILLKSLPYICTFLLSTICIFILFTPMHDASHYAISTQYRWMNDVIGRICGWVFNAPFVAFRWAHLEHHKHTNDPQLDPDFNSGSGPIALLPLRWITQIEAYYVHFFCHIGSLPVSSVIEAIITIVATHSLLYVAYCYSHFGSIFWAWLLPLRIAVMFLAYTFDYVPHRPHQYTRVADVYRSTSKTDGLFGVNGIELRIPLLYQNYHNIHHLYPFIPFYGYKAVWDAHSDALIANGTPLAPVIDMNRPWW